MRRDDLVGVAIVLGDDWPGDGGVDALAMRVLAF